ncbi:pyruvate, phosphate dikinase [Intrasporangium mesophilum]
MTSPLLVPFKAGDRSMADLLGGKGANLAEMTRIGLPVPGGFTITTEACRAYLAQGRVPATLPPLVRAAVADLEDACGRLFGDPGDPLLVSVRSGARFSMPGMMETVLNVGLTDSSVQGLADRGGERFAWDCYRRLVQMYGHTVLGVQPALYAAPLQAAQEKDGVSDPSSLSADALRDLVTDLRCVLKDHAGEDLPQDPWEQLDRSIEAVFASWNSARAQVYRAHEGISESLGTAVNVMQMVYGNTGPRSGSGVCFTRDPATGAPVPYGDYLQNAQGEDVVNGSRATVPLAALADLEPAAYTQLLGHLDTLERHYRDLCDVEFTVEDSRLWVLQTRVGKRSPSAAFVMAADMVDQGLITLDEALLRVDGHQLESLLHPRFDVPADVQPLVTGLPASPGASVGEVVFDPATAVSRSAAGQPVVLMRPETSAEDVDGILAAVAVVTARGGLASHAAVVARGFGRTCVTGVSQLAVDEHARRAVTSWGEVVSEGDVLSVDGTTGCVYAGALPIRQSALVTALNGEVDPAASTNEPVVASVLRLLQHADSRARLAVHVNAETPHEAALARRLGARGIGLCRTEHMLLGARRELVERVVVNDDRQGAFAEIERLALDEFTQLLQVMDGLPVVVRLLDPPLHEFLPDSEELAVEAALQAARGAVDPALSRRLEAVRRWQQANPMLGLRGVRLLTVLPELVDAHVRALVTAADQLARRGLHPRPELMVPLVALTSELDAARQRMTDVVHETATRLGSSVTVPIGVMIELPRAALRAGDLALKSDFFSFGTNDLTQTTWGVSRDDAQASFLTAYRTSGLMSADPFETLDEDGVGELVRIAIDRGRQAKPGLGLGVCGEHAGDPESIHFFSRVGLDYVSCSPPRVVVARLEAGRAAVLESALAATSDTR